MLIVDDIHTYYGNSHVLQGISLQVQAGKVVALLGRNGVGKTTIIKSIIGFQPPRRGRIVVKGIDVTKRLSHCIARLGVGLVPQGRSIFPTLTTRENITLAARDSQNRGWTLARVLETYPILSERMGHMGWQLSGGEQQMTAIARALMTNPVLLLMDEPSEGLAPLMVLEIKRIIRSIREEGISVLLVEQNVPLALQVADHVYIMNKGRIVFHGLPSELSNNEQMMNRYLGM